MRFFRAGRLDASGVPKSASMPLMSIVMATVTQRKVIWVSKEVAKDNQQLRVILAHEIVHAILGCKQAYHNKKFWQRLHDAAQVA